MKLRVVCWGMLATWTFAGCGQIGFEQLGPDAGEPDAIARDAAADAGEDPRTDTGTDVGTDASAEADASVRDCAAWGPFDPPVPLVELNSSDVEWAPHLSADQLTIFFARGSQPTTLHLWMAFRTMRSEPFGPPTPISELNSAESETSPTTSFDGRELLFNRDDLLYRATRPTPSGAFSSIVATSLFGDGPSLGGNGLTLYWCSGDPFTIYRAMRATIAAPFVSQGPIAELNRTSMNDGWPSVSADEREIFFEGESSGGERIHVATRDDTDVPFGAPGVVAELFDEAHSYPLCVLGESSDRQRWSG